LSFIDGPLFAFVDDVYLPVIWADPAIGI